MCVWFGPAGSVTLRSVIIALPEPRTTGMTKYTINSVRSESVYSMFSNAINLKKGKSRHV